MPSFLDLFAPQWQEKQRQIARQRFQAELQQPQMFNMEQSPIPSETMRQSYEQGYGIPYPQQQAPSPTAAIEGMTTDPNRGTTIEPPENLPIEYVNPRSLEERTQQAGRIEGMGVGAKRAGEVEHYQGLGSDFWDGTDTEDSFIPSNIDPYTTAGFKRPGATDNDPMVSIPGYGQMPASIGYHYLQDQGKPGQDDIMVDPDQEGPLPSMPSQHAYHYMQQQTGGEERDRKYKQALDTIKALDKRLDPKDIAFLSIAAKMGRRLDTDQEVQQRIQGKLSPQELRIINNALNYIEQEQQRSFGGKANDPDEIRGLLYK